MAAQVAANQGGGISGQKLPATFEYIKALRLSNLSGYTKRVRNLAVSVYNLIPSTSEQLETFASPTHAVAEAQCIRFDTRLVRTNHSMAYSLRFFRASWGIKNLNQRYVHLVDTEVRA